MAGAHRLQGPKIPLSPEIALPWRLDQIPYDRIDHDAVRHREDLLCLVCASSFVEILSDLTARNLVSFFRADSEVSDWLANHWEHEEVQHGQALREYVRRVWPEFDWDGTYARFFAEYSQLCTLEEFEATPCMEMAARCVVEMGTATYYRALHDFAPEPVLRELAGRIKDDEVRHYKHFYRYFTRYQDRERVGRWRTLRVLTHRLGAVRSEDADIALWHAFAACHPEARRDGPEFRALFRTITRTVRRHYPASMAVKMLLKPLTLAPALSALVNAPLAALAQMWILR